MADEEWETISPGDDEWQTVQPRLAGSDAGPNARRAAEGLPPGPAMRSPQRPSTLPDRFKPTGLVSVFGQPHEGKPGPYVDGSGRIVSPSDADIAAGVPQAEGAQELEQVEAAHKSLDDARKDYGVLVASGAAGKLVGAGVGALGAGKTAVNLATGAAAGGSSAALSGGGPKEIAAGAAAGGALSGLMQFAAHRAAKRLAEQAYQEFAQAAKGAGKTRTLARMEKIGPEVTADVLKRHEIGTITDAVNARDATLAAKAKVGGQIGEVYKAADAATGTTLGETMKAMEAVRKRLDSDATTKPQAVAMFRFMRDFYDANGSDAGKKIAPSLLHSTISKLNETGFAGTGIELSPAAGKVVARETAGALKGVLDPLMQQAAKKSPQLAASVGRLPQLNRDYSVLKTIEPIVKNQAIAQRFAPSFTQRLARDPKGVVANAAAGAAMAPVRGAIGAVNAADVALARLFSMRAAGQPIYPEAIAAAVQAGVSPQVAQRFQAAPQPVHPPVPAQPVAMVP